MKVGPCRAAFPRYFYNSTATSCEQFIFGGCGGNTNNFETKEKCEATCSGVTGTFFFSFFFKLLKFLIMPSFYLEGFACWSNVELMNYVKSNRLNL